MYAAARMRDAVADAAGVVTVTTTVMVMDRHSGRGDSVDTMT